MRTKKKGGNPPKFFMLIYFISYKIVTINENPFAECFIVIYYIQGSDYMKKFLLIMMSLVIMLSAFACQKPNEAPNEKSEANETNEVDEPDHTDGVALLPAVMLDGKLYKDTCYINSLVTCGTMDGKIDKVVPTNEFPKNDGESNFDKCEYQYAGDGFLTVYYEGKYLLFSTGDIWDETKKYVANFTGTVEEVACDEDTKDATMLRIKDIDVPEEFKYIFGENTEYPNPFLVKLDYVDVHKGGEPIDAKEIEGKKVTVYFDGTAHNTELTSSALVTIDSAYEVEVLD